MTLQGKLADRAAQLSRSIFVSLPIEVRVAHLLVQLKLANVYSQDTLARAAYAVFIARGVQGLPDVKLRGRTEEVPALSLQDAFKSHKLKPDHLPRGYGLPFAKKLWATIQKMTRNEATTEDVFMTTISKMVVDPELVHEGVPLRQAESLLFLMSKRTFLDMNKKLKREIPLDPGPDEAAPAMPAGVTQTLDLLESSISSQDILRRAEPSLRRVHPDAPLYLELRLQGYPDTEIIGNPKKNQPSMLPTVRERGGFSVQNWAKTLEKIRQVLLEYL